MTLITRFWSSLGGRKNANGYVTAALLTGAVVLFVIAKADPTLFKFYGAYLLAAMGITNAAIAWEDKQSKKEGAPEEN